jgi:amino acid permease
MMLMTDFHLLLRLRMSGVFRLLPYKSWFERIKFSFHICTVHPAVIKVFYYRLMHKKIVLKRIITIYIKITIAPTCFGVITVIRERTV